MTLAALITLIGQLGLAGAAWRLGTRLEKRLNVTDTRVTKLEVVCGISLPQSAE
jgi:hypothetical protein